MHWSWILFPAILLVGVYAMMPHGGGGCSAGTSMTSHTMNEGMNMSTKTTATQAQDPVCGMNVDPKTSIHEDRGGTTYYFCGEQCRKKFLAMPATAPVKPTSGGCCH